MKITTKLFTIVILLSLLLAATPIQPATAAGVRFAKPAASGAGDCSSWADACTLQTALTGASSGDEIWVAAGTHIPGALRTDTFQLKNGVAVYGGFDGVDDAVRDDRDPAVNVTILSGDVNGNDSGFYNFEDNVYHVIIGATGASMDGFTVTGGNATGSYPDNGGGGMRNISSSPSLTNITFRGNKAEWGGAIYNNDSSPSLTNVAINNNWGYSVSVMYNEYSNPSMVNVTINGNQIPAAYTMGIVIYNYHSSPSMTNVTFSGNSTVNGGIYNYNSSPVITNSIFWGDGTEFDHASGTLHIDDSIVQGGCPTGAVCTNLITEDPLLDVLANNGGFTQTMALGTDSPAIDAGNNDTCALDDQRGLDRPQGAQCDMGAYEVPFVNTSPTDIALTATSATENLPVGTLVGTLSTEDVDTFQTFSYDFTCTVRGTDDASFAIAGDSLSTAAVFDYETRNAYNICIRTDDGNGGTFDKNFTINVTDVPGLELLTPVDGFDTQTNRPTFEWNAYADAVNYQIQLALEGTFAKTALSKTVKAPVTIYVPTRDLLPDTLYYWRVRAKVGRDYTAWSETRTFTTGNPPPIPVLVAPGNNKLLPGSPLLFDWKDVVPAVGVTLDHYRIQIATDVAFTDIVHDKTPALSQDDTAVLPAGATYYWRVSSVADNDDFSAWSKVRSVKIKYEAPILLTPADTSTVGSLLPTFTWNATIGATSYTIQVSKELDMGPTVISKTVYSPTYTATVNLLPATTYYWRVKVNGPYGPSAYSLLFSFTTP